MAIVLHHYGVVFERRVLSTFTDFEAMLGLGPFGKIPEFILSAPTRGGPVVVRLADVNHLVRCLSPLGEFMWIIQLKETPALVTFFVHLSAHSVQISQQACRTFSSLVIAR